MPGCVAARVAAFDAARGMGTVVTDEGQELTFHAARISDGSRSVEVGARVAVEVGRGAAPGTWEATAVVKTA